MTNTPAPTYTNHQQVILGECRTLWSEHEQAACTLATQARKNDIAKC